MGESNDATPIPDEHRFPPTSKEEAPLPEPAPEPRSLLAPTTPEPPFDPVLRTRNLLPEAPPAKPPRLLSLDAFRGAIMVLLASHGLDIPKMVQGPWKDDSTWQAVAYQLDHSKWIGCTVWDMIQPCFMFMVGVAMPYSYASRKARGEQEQHIFRHAVWRSILLILIALFISTGDNRPTNLGFVNVLAQIGLGYTFVHLLLNMPRWLQGTALVLILGGYWLLFVLWPVPGAAGTNPAAIGPDEIGQGIRGLTEKLAQPEHLVPAFHPSEHFRHNENAAVAIDRYFFTQWFLWLFPGGPGYVENKSGYATLNFVPSMATMLLGVLAGHWLRGPHGRTGKLARLVIAGVLCVGLGLAWGGGWSSDAACPLVKIIWTPSWALYSGGVALLILAGFYLVVDVIGFQSWTFPLVVVGTNSIAMYLMIQLMRGWVRQALATNLAAPWILHYTRECFGSAFIQTVYRADDSSKAGFNGTFGPMIEAFLVMAVFWLICLWMYRRKIFLKV